MTFGSGMLCGFRTQAMLPMLMYDSELALHHSCCRSSKQHSSTSSGMWQGWATCVTCSELYIRRSVSAQGVEAPPRTSTSHLAMDPGSRPSAAQPRTKLSVETCPRSRMIETACGNGYAPVRGLPMMMMMNHGQSIIIIISSSSSTDIISSIVRTCLYV